MNGWSNAFYISLISVALLLSAMGLWLTAAMPGFDRWNRRFFRDYFIAIMVCCASLIADLVFFLYFFLEWVLYFALILESLLSSLPLAMLTVYLLHSASEDIRSSRLLHAVLGLWLVYVVLLISSPFIGIFTGASGENQKYRGPLYPILMLPLIAMLLLDLAGAIRRRARLPRKVILGINAALLPMIVTLTVNMFVEFLLLFDFCYVFSALVMYSFALSDQIEREMRHQREIARQQQEIVQQQLEIAHERASVMVLQMRPHFIYNTMTSIYCLYSEDPEKAQQVLLDFTAYLRKNFTAVASTAPITFSSELEHTRAYLAVEQALYTESLFVEYDIPHTFFRVPPLTLQPIVENAVKHGRDPYAGPLRILIRTRKTASGSEITVSDNGRGFVPADDSEPGIALKNIRQRLEMMCGGCLTIEPNEGGGTVVTVTIPDSAAQ